MEDNEVDIDEFEIVHTNTNILPEEIEFEDIDDNELENDNEIETEELNENEFTTIDIEAASIPEESHVNKYLAEIQERLRGKVPKEYQNGTFWVHQKNPYFMLEAQKRDPNCLYIPRVFLWLPHHLVKDLKCPTCEAKISVKGFNKKPRARRVIDLNEYDIILSFVFVFLSNVLLLL